MRKEIELDMIGAQKLKTNSRKSNTNSRLSQSFNSQNSPVKSYKSIQRLNLPEQKPELPEDLKEEITIRRDFETSMLKSIENLHPQVKNLSKEDIQTPYADAPYSSPKQQLKSGTEQSLESIQTVKIDSSMKRSDKRGLIITEEDLQAEEEENEDICLSEEGKKSKIDFNSRFQLTQKFQNLMNEADMDESEESEEEKNFVSGFGTSKTFSNFLESPSAFKAMPFRNTLFEDKKGYANTAGKQRFYSPISPCKPMPMQYNYINSSEKSRPILLGDPKMTNILEVLMEESIE